MNNVSDNITVFLYHEPAGLMADSLGFDNHVRRLSQHKQIPHTE